VAGIKDMAEIVNQAIGCPQKKNDFAKRAFECIVGDDLGSVLGGSPIQLGEHEPSKGLN
jgi:hypothetical protein